MTSSNTKIRLISTMIIAVFLGSAAAVADNDFTRYGEELDRCVAAARDNTIQTTTRQIRHFVTERGTAGVWAEFDIRTELYDVQDGPMIQAIESRCRAHRWNEKTVLKQ